MTSFGLNWNYGYTGQTSYNNSYAKTQNSVANQFDTYFIDSQQQYMTGYGDPLEALNHGLGLIDQFTNTGNTSSLNYNYNQNNLSSPFYNQTNNTGLNNVFQQANNDFMGTMATQYALQYQIQNGGINPNDPLAMNKFVGARMEQLGGDLKDDGIINGSNQKPNPMQMMMQLMMGMMQMIMQFIMGMLGQNNQQAQPYANDYNQQYNANDPLAMNKMMGARMERMGGDLKDDGVINGSNKPKPQLNPMQLMQGMMMLFAGMDTLDNGQLDGSLFRQQMA